MLITCVVASSKITALGLKTLCNQCGMQSMILEGNESYLLHRLENEPIKCQFWLIDAELLRIAEKVSKKNPHALIVLYVKDKEDAKYLEKTSSTINYEIIGESNEPKEQLILILQKNTSVTFHNFVYKRILTESLDKKKLKILYYITLGLNNQEICTIMTIKINTLRNYRSHICSILSIDDISQAVLLFIQSGLFAEYQEIYPTQSSSWLRDQVLGIGETMVVA